VPWSGGGVEGGFRGEGQMAVALEEGGPHNGVPTAVEDYLANRPDLASAQVRPSSASAWSIPDRARQVAGSRRCWPPYDRNP